VLKAPIVRYTFDNGQITNSGTNQTVTGKVTTLSGNNIVDPTATIEYTKDVAGVDNSAISLSHKKEGGNHFTISGINIGTGDFTIKTRMYMTGYVTNSSSSTYLLGIGNETDSLGNVKDVKSPYFNISMKKNGEKNQVRFVANSASAVMANDKGGVYVPHGKWIEVIVIRSENNLTLNIVELDNGTSNSITIALSSAEALNFNETCNLAFAGNSGSQNGAPGVYTYYDEIVVLDYALN
jgi:hypothetical protein